MITMPSAIDSLVDDLPSPPLLQCTVNHTCSVERGRENCFPPVSVLILIQPLLYDVGLLTLCTNLKVHFVVVMLPQNVAHLLLRQGSHG